MNNHQDKVPLVFISYCWTSDEHKEWVLKLAKRLVEESGVEVILDRWHGVVGHDRFHFMETSIKKADKVLVICDENYCRKANNREGGVGTETLIITPEVYANTVQEKFIPIALAENKGEYLLPDFFRSRFALGMIKQEKFEEAYKELERLVWEEPLLKPPVRGKKPNFDLSEESQIKSPIAEVVFNNRKEERVIWLLPRGFLLFKDITFEDHDSWAVVASYYDYDGNCQHSTHYHDSYSIDWDRDMETQFQKLSIPEADWNWGRAPLNFLMELREVSEKVDIQKLVEVRQQYDYPVYYYKPDDTIFLPKVPDKYKFYFEAGRLRDIIEEINDEKIRRGVSLYGDDLIQRAILVRQSVFLESLSYLGESHPSLSFIKEVLDEFDKSAPLSDILLWFNRLEGVLRNTLNHEWDVWHRQLKKSHN
ncbi:toll/interleukin-1 receptor domain-containing protein [Heyndrickxia oleronia]|uniref:toll/interleukin-1 receptor domain-containing protein n=1 Tax=Heyndrickxia oleronia TaxID=38875 RepID=UPI003F83F267